MPKNPCDRCGADVGLHVFNDRWKAFHLIQLCPRCAGQLVNLLIAFARDRQLCIKAPLMIDTRPDPAKDAEARRVEAANLPLPLEGASMRFKDDG